MQPDPATCSCRSVRVSFAHSVPPPLPPGQAPAVSPGCAPALLHTGCSDPGSSPSVLHTPRAPGGVSSVTEHGLPGTAGTAMDLRLHSPLRGPERQEAARCVVRVRQSLSRPPETSIYDGRRGGFHFEIRKQYWDRGHSRPLQASEAGAAAWGWTQSGRLGAGRPPVSPSGLRSPVCAGQEPEGSPPARCSRKLACLLATTPVFQGTAGADPSQPAGLCVAAEHRCSHRPRRWRAWSAGKHVFSRPGQPCPGLA